MPGIMPISAPMPPIFFICSSWSRRSSRSKVPFLSFSATGRVFGLDVLRRPSRRGRRCRPCRGCGRRCGRGGNPRAHRVFSPVPISLIGLPVTARIDSAAPPRPSPSTRVSTMPVRSTRSSKERARLTASWPVSASATSRISMRVGEALISAVSAISSSSMCGAAGGVEDARRRSRRAGRRCSARRAISTGGLAGDDRQRGDADLLAEHAQLLHGGRAARRRARPAGPSCSRSVSRLAILPVVVVLPEPCRPTIRIGDRRRGVEVDAARTVVAEHLDQLVVDDLDDLLAGRHRAGDLGADGALAHLLDEAATTSSATSASSSARRTSRSASSTSAAASAPRRGQPIEDAASCSDRVVEHRQSRQRPIATGLAQTILRPRAHALSGVSLRSPDRSAGRN